MQSSRKRRIYTRAAKQGRVGPATPNDPATLGRIEDGKDKRSGSNRRELHEEHASIKYHLISTDWFGMKTYSVANAAAYDLRVVYVSCQMDRCPRRLDRPMGTYSLVLYSQAQHRGSPMASLSQKMRGSRQHPWGVHHPLRLTRNPGSLTSLHAPAQPGQARW